MKNSNILKLILFFISINAFGQSLKVGEEVVKEYQSPHPYPTEGNGSLVWSQSIRYENATYIAVHFSKFQLANDDFLIVKSENTEQSWTYYDKGNYNSEKPNEGFWSVPVYGEEIIIEIHSKSPKSDYGYTIDKFARGYTEAEMGFESICGNDDSLEAKCYQSSEPNVYNRSKAVARLLINGTNACTGWLVGDQGHIMTNNHCVGSSSDANNVTVEFMAEGSSCSSNCQSWFACGGTIEASSTGLVQTNSNLDYSLLSLPSNVSGTYGFLQLRQAGASVGERIYIPQHPAAWGKRISLASDHSSDSSDGFAHIQSTTLSRCGGTGYDLGYYGDTQGGSSGSPVLGYSDNLVIGLHHCGGCPNKGVPIQNIISDLGSNIPNNALGCIDNLTITTNVSTTDYRQAINTITASNTIASGANAVYHAGNEVLLTSDFDALNGSAFRAHIEGCSGNFVLKQGNNDTEEESTVTKEDTPVKESINGLKLFPNPTKGVLNIKLKEGLLDNATIKVYSFNGAEVYSNTISRKNVTNHELDLSRFQTGIYIVKVTDKNGTTHINKVIKE